MVYVRQSRPNSGLWFQVKGKHLLGAERGQEPVDPHHSCFPSVWGLRLRGKIWGLGFGLWALRFGVWGLRFRV